jgi:parallel beta-helix repeat protein
MSPKLPETKGLMIALLFFVLTASASADDLDSCGLLDSPNTEYAMDHNINSSGTCITIGANNVTVNCRGYVINYSRTTPGFGVNNTGYDDVTVKNCVFKQGSTSNDSYGIFFTETNYGNISDNEITTLGNESDAIYLNFSSESNLSGNTIYCSGYSCEGIIVYWSSGNELSYNTIYSSGSYGDGINLISSSENSIFSNDVSGLNDAIYGLYILGASNDNNFSLNTVSTSGIYGNGIYVGYGSNNSFISNEVTTTGDFSIGVEFGNCESNNLSSNNITTSGPDSDGIIVSLGYGNILSSNIVSASGDSGSGIVLSEASYNTIANSTFRSSESYAVEVVDSEDNLLYNNLLNGSDAPVSIDNDTYANYWNISLQAGTRIYSNGTNIAGNYYTNPSGTGYSDTCTDANNDTFCDSSYNVATNTLCTTRCGNNTDYLAYSGGLSCELGGNNPPCGTVNLAEVVSYIQLWIAHDVSLANVIRLIQAWIGGSGT